MGVSVDLSFALWNQVLTTEAKTALIHKGSVNFSREATTFPSPFFVFSEKVRTRMVSCKGTTMVSPLQLLLLGSRRVELLPDGLVRSDAQMKNVIHILHRLAPKLIDYLNFAKGWTVGSGSKWRPGWQHWWRV